MSISKVMRQWVFVALVPVVFAFRKEKPLWNVWDKDISGHANISIVKPVKRAKRVSDTGACVVFCDVPEYSNSMDKFLEAVNECDMNKMFFVDPNIGKPPLEVIDVQLYTDINDVPVTRINFKAQTTPGNIWPEVGLSSYTGVPVSASSTLLADALLKAGLSKPRLFINGFCPPPPYVDHVVMHQQIASVMDDTSRVVWKPSWDEPAVYLTKNKVNSELIPHFKVAKSVY